MSGVDTDDLKERLGICIFSLDAWYFDDDTCRKELREHFHVTNLEGLGISDYDSGIIAAGALFLYLKETQKTALSQMTTIRPYTAERYMLIDSSSRRNLELVETLREKQKRGSLLWVLDKTKTAMGARTLRSFVEQPLIDAEEINRRLEALEELNEKPMLRDEIREYLNPVYDLERLVSRISFKSANPRDMVAFASSLEMIPYIKQVLKDFQAPILKEIYEDMDSLEDITDLIKHAIVDEPPLAQKDGGIIREGFNEDVDKFRSARTDGKKWLTELETKERERTGIKSLKIKYNRVFGYALEVTNTFKELVPENYIRKQTYFPYVILRPTGVYGPGEKDYFMEIQSVKSGLDFAVGAIPQRITFIYVKDLATVAFLSLEKEEIKNRHYFVADGDVYTDESFARMIQDILGKKRVLHARIPLGLVRIACHCSEWIGKLLKKSMTLNSDKYIILKQRNWICDVTPLQDDLGFIPAYPLRKGLEESIEWYKKEGWL